MLEMVAVVLILGILLAFALSSYDDYVDRVDSATAESDITLLQMLIDSYRIDFGEFPDSLADVGMGGKLDPWDEPYIYANHDNITPGQQRKDRNLVPINTDYDLYSKGPDGRSVAPLTAELSRDDIVRANDGGYIGLAEDY